MHIKMPTNYYQKTKKGSKKGKKRNIIANVTKVFLKIKNKN